MGGVIRDRQHTHEASLNLVENLIHNEVSIDGQRAAGGEDRAVGCDTRDGGDARGGDLGGAVAGAFRHSVGRTTRNGREEVVHAGKGGGGLGTPASQSGVNKDTTSSNDRRRWGYDGGDKAAGEFTCDGIQREVERQVGGAVFE